MEMGQALSVCVACLESFQDESSTESTAVISWYEAGRIARARDFVKFKARIGCHDEKMWGAGTADGA